MHNFLFLPTDMHDDSKKYQEKTAKSAKKRLQKYVKKIRSSPKEKQVAVKIFSYAGVSSFKTT